MSHRSLISQCEFGVLSSLHLGHRASFAGKHDHLNGQIDSETPREVIKSEKVKGDEVHRQGSQRYARTFDAARSYCYTAQC